MHLTVFYPALEVEARPHDLRHELLRLLATAAVVIVAGAAPKIVSGGVSHGWEVHGRLNFPSVIRPVLGSIDGTTKQIIAEGPNRP